MKNSTRILLVLLVIAAVLFSGFLGYRMGKPAESPEQEVLPEHSDKKLNISVVWDIDSPNIIFTPEDLNNNYTEDITYYGLSEVNIEIAGTTYPLEDAIRNGFVTVEEIIAWARTDTRNGVCKETYESEMGLNRFTYHYPTYKLEYIYDIYELPDGSQEKLEDFNIVANAKNYDVSHSFPGLFEYDEHGRLHKKGYEDWGISFEVVDASPTTLTMRCTQSGGMQLGNLVTEYFYMGQTEAYYKGLNLEYAEVRPEQALQMGGTTELVLDWSEAYGELPSDTYFIALYIEDIYDESEVHPLMKNYADRQLYYIDFTIP